MNNKIILALYALAMVCMGLSTVLEKYHGTSYVDAHVYDTWWFSALWGALTAAACVYVIKQRLHKRLAVMLLHMAFVVILAGALTTHLFAKRGTVSLRTGMSVTTYEDKEGNCRQLPFSLILKDFRVVNYPGTDAPLEYQSIIQCVYEKPYDAASSPVEESPKELVVSMNNIGHVDGYRFFQSSYDSDGKGVSLGVNYDPYGIAVTYGGNLLLLGGIIATFLSHKTRMRSLYRKALRPTAVFLVLAFHVSTLWASNSPQVVEKDIAHSVGTINVLYNNRICPLNTVATDFVTKLAGGPSWNGYSADEIFVSWMIFYSPWEQQKLIRVKNRDVQQLLGIEGQWASYSDFQDQYHEYKLKDALEDLRKGEGNIDRKGLMEADEKYQMVEMFYRGQFIKIFPFRLSTKVEWYMPGGRSLPREIPVKEQFFIKQSMDYLTESVVTGQHDKAMEMVAKIKLFQHDMIGDLLPADAKTKAEILYNTLRSQRWPVFLALTLSILLCVAMLISGGKWLAKVALSFVALLAVFVTSQLVLRWWLSGHVPVSNGPETMLFMAWVMLVLSLSFHKRVSFIIAFCPLASSFCLLVAMLGGNSSITPLMPVLQSPLLSVHVMTVMCAYALFALQLLLGIRALFLMKKKQYPASELEKTTALSQFLLYPAVFFLAIGIFLGAVWANVSWGSYWSWDPKETWALITLMVYAAPFHSTSIPVFHKPLVYHLYMVGAFLSVVVTYFGVNYLLGGMHSYA